MNSHSVDLQPKPIGMYNSQALGIIPGAYQFGRVATADKPGPILPPTKAKIMTVQKEEKVKKSLLKKQKELGKREVKATPAVDIASQQQFSEAVSTEPKEGGRKRLVKMIPTGVTQEDMTFTIPTGSSAKGGSARGGSARGGSARGGSARGGSATGGKKSAWMVALQDWNDKRDGKYMIPKKGTAEYDQVKALMK